MRICKRGKSACSVAKSDTLPAHVSCYDNEQYEKTNENRSIVCLLVVRISQPLKVIVVSKKAVREATCQ